MITVEDVSKTFDEGRSFAVRGVNLEIPEGMLLVLLGESGCGKTTTLKMINRLVDLSAGRILVGGEDIQATDPVQLRRRIGYVFQEIGLFPHMTVADNIGTLPRLLRWSRQETNQRIRELLEMVGLGAAELESRYPRELSGGQRQRVGVARALAARPKVLLMDEPFGALDPITRDELQDQFKSLQGTLGLTVVLVTHDMTEALLLADRVVVMKEGRIVGEGTPAELMTKAQDPYVKKLMDMPKRQAGRVDRISGTKA
ncbi:MAG: ABC transporter ATP-binding protein [Gemmatimonadota bacterium]